MAESFEKEFSALRELGADVFVLRGSSIIVEIQEKEEVKTKGGIIIESPESHVRKSVEAHRVLVAKVLMTGPGYWDTDSGSYEPLEVKPGSVVLMPQDSFNLVSHFPGISRPTLEKVAMIKMDSVIGYYPTEEAYRIAREKLNA